MPRILTYLILLAAIISIGQCGRERCSTTSNCSGNKICIKGRCSYCSSNSNCATALPSKPYCQNSICVECKQNSQCTSPTLSKCSGNTCSPCSSDSDCSHMSGAKNKCSSGVCVECYQNSHCASGLCSLAVNLCQGTACTIGGGECSPTPLLPACYSGFCRSCGADTTFCPSLGMLCVPDGSCKQCWQDTDCSLATSSECLSGNICGTCTADTHCSHISGKYKCLLGSGCVECISSSDCPPGDSCVNNLCAISVVPLVIKVSTTDEPDVYTINFPIELVTNTVVENGIAVDLAGIDNSIYSYTIVKITETQYEIHFKVTQTVPSTILEFRYTYISLTGTGSDSSIYDVQITSKRIPYTTEALKAAAQTMQAIGGAATAAMSATSGSILILGGNPAIMWALINLIQAFYYLIFVNVDYPANVQFFLKIFTLAGFDFIPNPMEWITPEIKDQSLPTPARFEEYDIDGLFLVNAGNMMLVWFVVFSLYTISLLLNRYLNRLSRFVPMIFGKIVGWFEWSGVLRALITSYAEIIQATFLQLRVITFDSGLFIASSSFAIVFCAFGFTFPFLTFLIVKKFSRTPRKLHRKFAALVDEYAIQGNYPKYFTTVMLIKRLLITLVLVFLHDLPYLEIFILIAFSIITIILMVKWKPYPTKISNYLNIISEILFTIIELIIFVLIHDDHIKKFSEDDRINIGWVLIATCGVIVLINLGTTVAEQIKTLREVWKLIKKVLQKETKKSKIAPRAPKLIELLPSPLLNTSSVSNADSSMISNGSFMISSPEKKHGKIWRPKLDIFPPKGRRKILIETI